MLLVAVVGLTAVVAAQTPKSVSALADLNGDWAFVISGGYSDTCVMPIAQTSSSVAGTFSCPATGTNGSFNGTVTEIGGVSTLDVTLTITPVGGPTVSASATGAVGADGNTFSGTWSAPNFGLNGSFTGTRLVAPPPPTPVDFDWSVPARFGFDNDNDGMVDYYAPSGSLVIEPDGWQVDFVQTDPATCDPTHTREWAIDGTQVSAADPAVVFYDPTSCSFSYKFPDEGTFDVELLVSDSQGPIGGAASQVLVQDWLIVSIGDSVASGEGVPDLPITPTRSQETWQSQRCHRSANAGPAEAARNLENADPKTSVTFVHLACSGATIVKGLLNSYGGIERSPEPRPAAQIDQINQLIQSREIDALTVSIGANDVEFSDTLVSCMIWGDCHLGQAARKFNRLSNALPSRYDSLAQYMATALPDVSSDRVYFTEYFDPTRFDDFSVCGGEPPNAPSDPVLYDFPIANSIGLGISQAEATWASQVMLPTLNARVQGATSTHGWNYVGGIFNQFRLGHGYCATDPWIVTYTQSQQDQDDKNGTIHPNVLGHFVYASALVGAMEPDLYPSGSPRPPAAPPAP